MRKSTGTMLLLVALAAATARSQEQREPFPFGLIIAEQARASFTLAGAGARAAGMGGAFTAVADDATAASFNPAGLAQLLIPEASIVWTRTDLTDDYRSFVTILQDPLLLLTDTTVEHDIDGLNFLSLTFPFRLLDRRFALQLSHHQVVNFDYQGTLDFFGTDRQEVRQARILQSSAQQGDISTRSASLAVELTQRTLVGVTFNSWEGDWTFDTVNARVGIQDASVLEFLNYSQRSSLRGSNVDLGILLRYPGFNIGARYRTRFDADYSIRARVQPAQLSVIDALDTKLGWPSTWNVGAAIKPFDRWLIALDWGRTDWSRLDFEVSQNEKVNFFDLLPPDSTLTSSTDDWRIGTELLFFAGKTVIPVRAGWFHEPHPSHDVFTGEQLVSEGYSFGFGIKRGVVALDLAVRYGTADARVGRFFLPENLATSTLAPNSFGNLERETLTAYGSLIIQFPKGSGVRDILDRIFVGPPPEPAGDQPQEDDD